MHVIDLEGNPYPCQATITQDLELNGNQTLSASILPTKVNQAFIDDIEQMWNIVDHDNVEYKIIYAKRKGKGKLLSVDIKAIPLFFDELDNDRIYEEYNEHMTAQRCFNLIFEDTNFNFVLVGGGFLAVEWEGFGAGESKLESFKRAIERYKAEFRIQGNTVYLEHQIGRDTQFQYRHRLNASNIVQENDAAEMWTYAKGYGDYDDAGEDETGEDTGGWQNARLIREYTSPLASVIGIRHAPPIKNGKIKLRETMDEALKTLVDESLKISVSADIHDFRAQGYPLAQPQLGDRVFLIDERIGLKAEVRAVNMNITRNWKGDVIDLQLTFGTPNLMKRYQSNLNTATKIITDALEGKRKLPVSVLDDVVQEVTAIIKGNDSSVFRYMTNGVIGWNGDDPNYMTRYVGDAIGFSDDGGATFETAMSSRTGINANVIRTGTMLADRISGGILSSLNGNTEFNLNTGILEMENTEFKLKNGAIINFTDVGNKVQFKDQLGGSERFSGLGVGLGIEAYPYPISFMGTSEDSGVLDALDESFTGLIVHSQRAQREGANTSIIGSGFLFRDKVEDFTKVLRVDFKSDSPSFHPTNTGEYDYRLGIPESRFAEVHARNIYGTLANTSTYNAKMNIEDVDGKQAFDYFDQMKIKSFYYKEDDYTNPYNRKVSPVIEQLDPVLEKLYKADPKSLDINSNLFLLAKAFQYDVKQDNERMDNLESHIQDIYERLDVLESEA